MCRDRVRADYKPTYYWWDCLEMLRKATLTGLLIFFRKGSLFQLVAAMTFCLGFLCTAAWLQPYASRTANLFKVGSEASLLVTLMLVVLLKIDLEKEDISESFLSSQERHSNSHSSPLIESSTNTVSQYLRAMNTCMAFERTFRPLITLDLNRNQTPHTPPFSGGHKYTFPNSLDHAILG